MYENRIDYNMWYLFYKVLSLNQIPVTSIKLLDVAFIVNRPF